MRLGPKWGWLLIPFLWTGLEYFRSELYYLRFSWLNAGYAFAGAPWQGTLKLVGVYGIGFLLVSLAAAAAFLWQKSRIRAVAMLLAGAGGVCLWGSLEPQGVTIATALSQVRVAGIQMEFPTENEVLFRLNDLVRKHPETELVGAQRIHLRRAGAAGGQRVVPRATALPGRRRQGPGSGRQLLQYRLRGRAGRGHRVPPGQGRAHPVLQRRLAGAGAEAVGLALGEDRHLHLL